MARQCYITAADVSGTGQSPLRKCLLGFIKGFPFSTGIATATRTSAALLLFCDVFNRTPRTRLNLFSENPPRFKLLIK